jgi:hypothetical protein
LDGFEIDIAFKRIKIKGLNEILFACYSPVFERCKQKYEFYINALLIDFNNLAIIYCRAYINYESIKMYQIFFHKVFDLMKARTGKLIKWNHIHSEELKYVVIDMNSK